MILQNYKIPSTYPPPIFCRRNIGHFISILLITVVSTLIYVNSLKNGFVYDDNFTIVNNILIKDFHNISRLFTSDYFFLSQESSYRPVVTVTYFLDYAVYGLKPYGYHLTNIILHIINGTLLYIFLTLLIKQPINDREHWGLDTNMPLFISLLFVTHPAMTEAVNGISYREDLLMFLFYMTALILYVLIDFEAKKQYRTPVLYGVSYLFYLIALLSKEMAITLPLIIYCYIWIHGSKERKRSHLMLFSPYLLGYIAVTLLYIYIRFYLFLNPVAKDIYAGTLTERLITMPWLIMKYFTLLMVPISLSAEYNIDPVSLISPNFIISLLVLGIILIGSSLLLQRRHKAAFGIIFFLVTLIPVYDLIPLANPFAERYLYLPSVGFAVFMGLALHLFIKRLTLRTRTIFSVLILLPLLIIIIYSFGVVKRNQIWKNDYSLWSDTVIKVPNSARAHYNLGLAFVSRSQLDEAMNEFLIASTLNQYDGKAHNNLGNIYFVKNRLEEAKKEYLLALELDPNNAEAHNSLGYVYFIHDRLDMAIKEYLIALKLKPNYLTARKNLIIAYKKKGVKNP